MAEHQVIVVMGVAGAGKTTVGRLLAKRLGLPYAEADDFHPPANVAKMASGVPLSDDDRMPWLHALAEWIAERSLDGGGVVTCSALKRRYRDLLRGDTPDVRFVHLTGSPTLLAERMNQRRGHFMPPSLLDSQLADLEPLGPDEPGTALDIAMTPDELVQQACGSLR
jgi:gluconokinase